MSSWACDDVVLAPSFDIICFHVVAVTGQPATAQNFPVICAQHVHKNYHAFLEYPVGVMAIPVPASACWDSLELLILLCTRFWRAMMGDAVQFLGQSSAVEHCNLLHPVHTTSLLAHSHLTDVLQGSDGHLKPIPEEDDFATPRGGSAGGRSPPPTDPDLALAIRLQQEEMARLRSPPAQPQPQLPAYMSNPVGPPHPASLPQRARSVLLPDLWQLLLTSPSCHYKQFQKVMNWLAALMASALFTRVLLLAPFCKPAL